jgi:MoxR-like ATPase
MQDRSVTVDGVTRPLPAPFLVVATQNPVESQGTYPLPEAQLDRFLLKIDVRHPSKETERQMLTNYIQGFDPAELGAAGLRRILEVPELLEMQSFLGSVRVEPDVVEYVTDVVSRTRTHSLVYLGASPRGSVALMVTARAWAASQGRDFVTPDDVKAMAPAVLRHRLLLHPDAELEGVSTDQVIESVLRETVVPKTAA